jgi:serine/threonine protein kinase
VKSRDPLIGKTLDGRFVIEEVLGTGGISVVYKATQLRVNRPVAIKTLQVRLDGKEIYRERFQREISSLCKMSHPNIVTVFDCIIGEDGQPYVVMDYLRGRSLQALIDDTGPLSLERFARISLQICGALDHAHKRDIVHRDLKPGNIVLMDDEMDFVKVVDFGLATLGEDSRKLTQTGEIWGSPPYMSPEQCMGRSGDARSDIYSLGVLMFEMLAGQDPYHGSISVYEFIQNHVNIPPPKLSQVNASVSVPPAVESVIFKALAKDPSKRYQSGQLLQTAILEACSGSVDRNTGDFLLHLAGEARSNSSEPETAKGEPDNLSSFDPVNSRKAALNLAARLEQAVAQTQPKQAATPEALSFASPGQIAQPRLAELNVGGGLAKALAADQLSSNPNLKAIDPGGGGLSDPANQVATRPPLRPDRPQRMSRFGDEIPTSDKPQGKSFTVLLAVLAGAIVTICILVLAGMLTINKSAEVKRIAPEAASPIVQTPVSEAKQALMPEAKQAPKVEPSVPPHVVRTASSTLSASNVAASNAGRISQFKNNQRKRATYVSPQPAVHVGSESSAKAPEGKPMSDPWSTLNRMREGGR